MRTEETKKNLSAYNFKTAHKGPAYLQLASHLRLKIADGEYAPGQRIPSESLLSRSYGVAVMTVRQAVGLLAEEGLVKRIQGRGTFVCGLDWTRASFNLAGLWEKLSDQAEIDIQVLKAGLTAASPRAAEALNLEAGTQVTRLLRLVSRRRRPILLDQAFLVSPPPSPQAEPGLEASPLPALIPGLGRGLIKKAALDLKPALLSPAESAWLETDPTVPAFKISYIFYGHADSPLGTGWLLVPARDGLSFSAKIGAWKE